ncbi:unnamed protein product [Adineta steineri]|uniref:Alpha-(1,6)-fucosyltransferase N- and catalytic domain-containing protein n=2 Tax=Adineta steineri TaxID=433720 RepID=A0A819DMZ5_9BILA|nr:unnamed protein product [Adineta steineri]
MAPKFIRLPLLLGAFFLVFLLGVHVGSRRNILNEKSDIVNLFSNVKLDKELQSKKEESLKSFSFAYNKTHLWSMPLANEDYYRIARALPCRTVTYVGGLKNESMDSCSQATINEFSIESTLQAQKWIHDHQNPANCENKKFAIIQKYAGSGFGSTIHQILWAFGTAIGEGRIAVYQVPGNWLYGSCSLSNPDCIFLPISNCSVPSDLDFKKVTLINANIDHWFKPVYPPIFANRSFNWYRSQLLFYLMRYNSQSLNHVQRRITESFDPPSIDLHHPFISVYVRRSDKVLNREMSQAYHLQRYFSLFDEHARLAKISNVYINSEDGYVFKEFEEVNRNKKKYYKLLSINTTRNIVFSTLMGMSIEHRGEIVLEFLTDLFIEAHADLHAGTLTSNWCRLVDEIRLVLGKRIPYYTPENRFLVDV